MDPEDPIDRLLEQWHRERPELELAPMALVARLMRLSARLDREVGAGLAGSGLQTGWFDVLSALRRGGKPFRMSPGELASAVMLSSGGMTKRLDRMEAEGLIARRPDPDDRRGLLIELTASGRRRIDRAIEAHLANEERLLA